MLGTDDDSITRRRAVVRRAREGAAKEALRLGRLNATVRLTGALTAFDGATPDDYRRFFMAWQATRVLRPVPTALLPATGGRGPSSTHETARSSGLWTTRGREQMPTTAHHIAMSTDHEGCANRCCHT
jgi:hypothetical protein